MFHLSNNSPTPPPTVFTPPSLPTAPVDPASSLPAASPYLSDTLALANAPAAATQSALSDYPIDGDGDKTFSVVPREPFTVPPLTEAEIPPHQEQLYGELGRAAEGPGSLFNMVGKNVALRRYNEDTDSADIYTDGREPKPVGTDIALYESSSGEQRLTLKGVTDVPAPASMDGAWDPQQFAPHYVFAEGEDAFPVRPDFDGSGEVGDDGSTELSGTKGDAYRDGVIDEDQALSGGFLVSQKGEYTVLTYSNYYATNKAAHYHNKDYSTAQVYLKENAEGKMEPAFLATSWHYGTQMTPWKDVKKDAQGHPVIEVGRGSHSLQPLGVDDEIPAGGLQIRGDGTATMDGASIGHRMTYDALQSNVTNANQIDIESPEGDARRETLGFGSTAIDPLLPELLPDEDTGEQLAGRLEKDIESLFDEVEDPATRQRSLMVMLDAAASTGAAGSQAYFDGVQRALEGIDVTGLTDEGRTEMRAVADLLERRGTEHSRMRAEALRLMADPGFEPEVARQLAYAMENGENNTANLGDALEAAGENTAEYEAIRLVAGAIAPQEDWRFQARYQDLLRP